MICGASADLEIYTPLKIPLKYVEFLLYSLCEPLGLRIAFVHFFIFVLSNSPLCWMLFPKEKPFFKLTSSKICPKSTVFYLQTRLLTICFYLFSMV